MRLDGVHIHVDERGIVEELGDLAVTVDIRTVPVVTVTGLLGAQDALRICSKEPAQLEDGIHALWFEAGEMRMKKNDVATSVIESTALTEKSDMSDGVRAQADERVSKLETEVATLRETVKTLQARIENTKSRNKRLEQRLAEAKAEKSGTIA